LNRALTRQGTIQDLTPSVARSFPGRESFRRWLEKHHDQVSELLLLCRKTGAAGRGVTYRDALDEALCIGWIDGVRRAVDESTFSVRFTPRKPKSAWSAVNIARARELEAEGRMHPAGLAAFRARGKPAYSYESRPRALAPAYLAKLRAHPRAWAFFEAQAPWYRRTCAFWIMSAKRPETRTRRLDLLIARSERHEGVPPLKAREVTPAREPRPGTRPPGRSRGEAPGSRRRSPLR
jgi:uncharacterized protein YdeI (YjbR/CyaY-like superfamily)